MPTMKPRRYPYPEPLFTGGERTMLERKYILSQVDKYY